jgi:hypothetical protein
MRYQTRVFREYFEGPFTPGTASADGKPWIKTDVSSSGTPTLLTTAAGLVGTLAATDEVENLCVSFGDVLFFDIDQIVLAKFDVAVAGIDSATTFVCGLGSARHDTPDSVAANAWFRLQGSASLSALLVESDDGTNDNDDKATGLTLGATSLQLAIDFKNGIFTQSPPAAPLGGKAAVSFFAQGSQGLQRVADRTHFNMSNYSAGLQPIIQLQKTGGTGTPSFTLRGVEITYLAP